MQAVDRSFQFGFSLILTPGCLANVVFSGDGNADVVDVVVDTWSKTCKRELTRWNMMWEHLRKEAKNNDMHMEIHRAIIDPGSRVFLEASSREMVPSFPAQTPDRKRDLTSSGTTLLALHIVNYCKGCLYFL